MQHRPCGPFYDIAKMEADLLGLGLNPFGLARRAEVSHTSVYRFLAGKHQTAPMARKIAYALGYPVKRYVLPARKRARVGVSA